MGNCSVIRSGLRRCSIGNNGAVPVPGRHTVDDATGGEGGGNHLASCSEPRTGPEVDQEKSPGKADSAPTPCRPRAG